MYVLVGVGSAVYVGGGATGVLSRRQLGQSSLLILYFEAGLAIGAALVMGLWGGRRVAGALLPFTLLFSLLLHQTPCFSAELPW